ncbi:MAG: hypothetical protein HY756_11690 [Nitrospirae bacterium]|nr:hypothetical protein [Nitrospirota bacterium]
MKKPGLLFIIISFAILNISGCGSMLPSANKTTISQWDNFDTAKATFDLIIPGKTNIEDLKNLGFNPFSTPNVKILNYIDIIQLFMANPSIKKEELDEGIRTCIDAKSKCRAYEIEPKIIKSKRQGNFWLDLFNFKRHTRESGWSFKALIVTVDDIVIYKLWGGSPVIDEEKVIKNPLGPLQNGESLIRDVTTKSINP